jgi:hypothetical protein
LTCADGGCIIAVSVKIRGCSSNLQAGAVRNGLAGCIFEGIRETKREQSNKAGMRQGFVWWDRRSLSGSGEDYRVDDELRRSLCCNSAKVRCNMGIRTGALCFSKGRRQRAGRVCRKDTVNHKELRL